MEGFVDVLGLDVNFFGGLKTFTGGWLGRLGWLGWSRVTKDKTWGSKQAATSKLGEKLSIFLSDEFERLFQILHPRTLTAGASKSPMKRKENDLPNLQGIMFQPLIFRGVSIEF